MKKFCRKKGSCLKCQGCKYYRFHKTTAHFICLCFKDDDGLVFYSAKEAYILSCSGRYKKED